MRKLALAVLVVLTFFNIADSAQSPAAGDDSPKACATHIEAPSTADGKLVTPGWVDYVTLCKVSGEWKIVRRWRDTTSPQSCPVTIGQKSDVDPAEFFGSGSAHWENNLYVGGLWPNGTIVFEPGGAGYVYPDGSVGMKIAWYRGNGLRGKITIQGERLDAAAPPLRSRIGTSETGFEASQVIFPTEGCWQVTGKVADASVTFVTRVVKLPGLKPNAHD
jgi:hypothetical protein